MGRKREHYIIDGYNVIHSWPELERLSKGELAEAFVFGGVNIQKERLEKEGVKVIGNKVDLSKYQWEG